MVQSSSTPSSDTRFETGLTLSALPAEIWQHIFAWACTDGGATGCALALVSHSVHDFSAAARLRSVAVSGLPGLRALLRTLRRAPEQARRVRVLYVGDGRAPRSELARQLEAGAVPLSARRFTRPREASEPGRQRKTRARRPYGLAIEDWRASPGRKGGAEASTELLAAHEELLAAHEELLRLVAPHLDVLVTPSALWWRLAGPAKLRCGHLRDVAVWPGHFVCMRQGFAVQ